MQDNTYLIDKYYSVVNEICDHNGYSDNIRHLLYVIMPAFVVKYGSINEKTIIDCFKETLILVGDSEDSGVEAFFDRKLFSYDQKYFSKKYIVINGLNKSEYIYLIDSIVHEFNHSLNSIKNEIVINGDVIFLRTGLSYIKGVDNKFEKTKSYILEEIVNTKQSEEIISIIYNLIYNGNNSDVKGFLETVKKEKNQVNFKSNAYKFYMDCCRELIDNKTFIKNVEVYRLNGDIDEIELFFDGITGIKGSYNELNGLLFDTDELIKKYDKSIFPYIIRKGIRNNLDKIRRIITSFCSSTVYK